jgi:chromosome segregation ATPase
MTISDIQRQHTEARIRAATDRLLGGAIPAGGTCDIKTLAAEAGISRAALYRTYPHLKEEFTQRRARLRGEGHHPDPRDTQIVRLKEHSATLKTRIADLSRQITELAAFQTTAISQLAAQHDEIQRLRTTAASHANIIALPISRKQP